MRAAIRRPRVVIAGGGFGGLAAARALADSEVDVTLVDRANYHTFLPLLYQVAAAELSPTDIAFPIRSIFRRAANVRLLVAGVEAVDLDGGRLLTSRGALPYDHLVMALGSETHFFGVPGAERYALPLRWMEDAERVRERILSCFEEASSATAPVDRARLLTFCVVGGGATGVEFAGALAELVRGPLLRDYPEVRSDEASIVLLESGPRVLPFLPERLSRYARDRLRARGVEVRTRCAVRRVGEGCVELDEGERISCATTVWTAGVRGDPRVEAWGLPVGPGGRIPVGPTLEVEGRPGVYVVGDLAYVEDGEGRPIPQVAPAAVQEGRHAASAILATVRGEQPPAFTYRDPGMLAVIGRNAAVARLGRRTFRGFAAWTLWLVIHIAKLIGGRNRALVLVNWGWNYLSYRRAVRLLLARPRLDDRRS